MAGHSHPGYCTMTDRATRINHTAVDVFRRPQRRFCAVLNLTHFIIGDGCDDAPFWIDKGETVFRNLADVTLQLPIIVRYDFGARPFAGAQFEDLGSHSIGEGGQFPL
jgi:hypothetical protein